ncbi:MAG: FHA domain-containing protein [Pseudomonadota bacterium]
MEKCKDPQCPGTYDPNNDFACNECGVKKQNTTQFDHACQTKACDHDKDTMVGLEKAPDIDNTEESHQITLEYRHLKLVKSEHGVIPLRLTNPNDYTIKRISFCAESAAFAEKKIKKEITVQLDPLGKTKILSCEFVINDRKGYYNADVTITAMDHKDRPKVFSGIMLLYIGDENSNGSEIEIDDLIAQGTDVIIEGYNNVKVKGGKFQGSVLNIKQVEEDVLGEKIKWLSTPIEFDIEKTRIYVDSLSINTPPLKPVINKRDTAPQSRQTHAVLAIHTHPEPKMIRLWTGKECVIGRSETNKKGEKISDIVVQRMPNNGLNQKWNQYISSKHAGFKIESFKNVVLKDYSMNGTFINGKPASDQIPVRHGDVISLAHSLTLKYYAFRDLSGIKRSNQELNRCHTMMDCTMALSSLDMDDIRSKAPLEGVLLKRTDDFKHKLEYLLVVRSVDIGSGLTVPVFIKDDSVDERHAKLSVDQGCYYIEDYDSKNGTYIKDKRLSPYSRTKINSGDELRIGNVKVSFDLLQ